MLQHRPHTLVLEPAEDVSDGSGTVVNTGFQNGPSIRGQVTPLKPVAAFERWGKEIDRPHDLLVNIEDGQTIRPADRLRMGTRAFVVEAGPQIWDAEPSTSCAAFLLREILQRGDA